MVIHATTDYSTIFTLFLKVGYVGYGFLVAFGFLLHKTDEIYYRKPVWARAPTRGLTVSAERPGIGFAIGFAMDLLSSVFSPGTRKSLLVECLGSDSRWVYGHEIPFGHKVMFRNEGSVEHIMTLYDFVTTGVHETGYWMLECDDQSSLFGNHTPGVKDLGFAHDVCCGLGGFGTAVQHLGGLVVSAVDFASLAVDAFRLNHVAPCVCADIGSLHALRFMHQAQHTHCCQPLLCAGFPCQPYSRQGAGKGMSDPRSGTLNSILYAARLLHVCAGLLECVPEASGNKQLLDLLTQYADLDGFHFQHLVLHLHSVWPAKRSRWFALLVRKPLLPVYLRSFPLFAPGPVIRDLILEWPMWPAEEEAQLEWTPLEHEVYGNPSFGDVNRQVIVTEPLPTALHSWGNALYPCPCSCRKQGLSKATLLAGGLRGVQIVSARPPYLARHIHPRELQFLLGFPPFQLCHHDCRAALCLLGNAVSPIQVVWILAQIWENLLQHLSFRPNMVGLGEGCNAESSRTDVDCNHQNQTTHSWWFQFATCLQFGGPLACYWQGPLGKLCWSHPTSATSCDSCAEQDWGCWTTIARVSDHTSWCCTDKSGQQHCRDGLTASNGQTGFFGDSNRCHGSTSADLGTLVCR